MREPDAALATNPAGAPSRSTRQRAALLLKPRYIAAGRSRELVRVLQVELAVAASDTDRSLTYRELVTLQLDTLRDDAGALEALAALVVLEPAAPSHRALLNDVASRLEQRDRQAKVLVSAAERATAPAIRAELLLEAAAICEGPLAAATRAIDLYQRVMELEGVDASVVARAARTLSTLLDAAGRMSERISVLERLAEIETDPGARKAALGEVARIATKDFGDQERAIRAWRARLEDDPADLDAIAGMRETLGAQTRWRELTGVLERAALASPHLAHDLFGEAARISERELGDAPAAIRFHEKLLAAMPDDIATMNHVATLYRQEGRLAELLDVRTRQIVITGAPTTRVALRLEIAKVLEERGAKDDLVRTLEANLDDATREHATVEALAIALDGLGRHGELVSLIEKQAELAENAGEITAASELWGRAATLAHDRLGDIDRAIADHEKAHGDAASLDALAALYLRKHEPLAAASALERLFVIEPANDRIPVLLRLSAAYVAGSRRDTARRRLEQALDETPDARLRSALIDIYRADEAWAPLAKLLTVEAHQAEDVTVRVELLREAAAIHVDKRDDAASAVPLLEEALSSAKNPVVIALALAPALVRVRRVDDAITMLRARIAAFGARRPKERALVHHALAQALSAKGEPTEALAELDLAVKIDPLNLPTRRALADAAAESGDLETAQRMLRALLLVVPRVEGNAPVPITRAEIFVSLADLADKLDDKVEAKECIDAAISAARESDAELVAVERELAARGMYELYATLLEERLERTTDIERAAATCDRLASVYEDHLGRTEEAATMRLRALATTPASPDRHRAALAIARATGRVPAYLQLCRDQAKETTLPEQSYELESCYGIALEGEGEFEEAAGAFERAEQAARGLEPTEVGGRRPRRRLGASRPRLQAARRHGRARSAPRSTCCRQRSADRAARAARRHPLRARVSSTRAPGHARRRARYARARVRRRSEP